MDAVSATGDSEFLSADEIARAERFLMEQDRARFISCRAALRRVLAGLLGSHPAVVEFEYSPFGKPALAGQHRAEVHFNVSHSQDLAVIAASRRHAVGIDVEQLRPDFASEDIARRFFSPSEREALAQLPAEVRVDAFFRCWTRKEAFVKAIGEGLSFPLDAFEVTLGPNQPPRLLRVGADPAAASTWSLHDLPVPSGFVAALAIAGRVDRIVSRTDFI